MTTMDKAAIGWSIAIVAAGVAFAFAGQGMQDAGTSFVTAPTTSAPSPEPSQPAPEPEPETMTDPFADIAAKVKETPKAVEEVEEAAEMVVEEAEEVAEDIGEAVKEPIEEMATGPTTVEVSMPTGTSVPGCEETNECYIPAEVMIFVGDTVAWINDDTAAHTVTAGSPQDGPSGEFDSSLVMGGATFEHTFTDAGTYEYFCMVHPWMIGTVEVRTG